MAVDSWALVATLTITLIPGEEEVAGWKNVATLTITLIPGEEEVAGWALLRTITVTLAPGTGEVAQWKLVDTKTITLIIPTITCSIDADCPEGYLCMDGVCIKKEAGFPWAALGIAGAAIAGTILIISGRRKKKEK
jgi:hypothetical protein